MESLICDSHLTESQQVGLQAASVLCVWCSHESARCRLQVSAASNVPTPQNVRAKLLGLLDDFLPDSPWDPTQPYHLQLVSMQTFM